jgi:hypothetical protein
MKAIHVLTFALALSLVAVGLVLANGGVERGRQVLGGGASDSAAGQVSLRATLGQSVVGVVSQGDVILGQGYWHGGAADHTVYLPLVVRDLD